MELAEASTEASTRDQHFIENALSSPLIKICIEAGDGSSTTLECSVHSALLKHYSGYFRGLLSSGLKEALLIESGSPILLKELDPLSVRSLFAFLYTKRLALSPQTVLSLITAAQRLVIPAAIEAIERFLDLNVSIETVCSFIQETENAGLHPLAARFLDYARAHFQEVSRTPGWTDLSATTLAAMFAHLSGTKSESLVLESLIAWLEAQPPPARTALLLRFLALEAHIPPGIRHVHALGVVDLSPDLDRQHTAAVRLAHLAPADFPPFFAYLQTVHGLHPGPSLLALAGGPAAAAAAAAVVPLSNVAGRHVTDPRPFVAGGSWTPLKAFTRRPGQPFSWEENPRDLQMPINAGDVHPTLGLIATGMKDGSVLLSDLPTGRPIKVLHDHRSCVIAVSFSPNGLYLATGSEGCECLIWGLGGADCSMIARLDGHDLELTGCCFSHDSSLFISSSFDGTVRIYRVTPCARPLLEEDEDTPLAGLGHPDSDHDGEDVDMEDDHPAPAAGPSGHAAAAAAAAARSAACGLPPTPYARFEFENVIVVDAHRQEELPGAMVGGICAHPTKRWLATTSVRPIPGVDIWDLSDTANLKHLGFCGGHSDGAWQTAWSPEGRFLVSGAFDNTVRVFDGTTFEPVTTLGHQGQVLSLSFSLDGTYLASTSRDGLVLVHRLPEGRRICAPKSLAFGDVPIPPKSNAAAWKNVLPVEGFEVRIVASAAGAAAAAGRGKGPRRRLLEGSMESEDGAEGDRDQDATCTAGGAAGANERREAGPGWPTVQIVAWASNMKIHLMNFYEEDAEGPSTSAGAGGIV